MLKIDHLAMSTTMPDYYVTMDNKGLATFKDRNIVNIKNQTQFNVSNRIAMEIYGLYASVDFYHRDADKASGNLICPMFITSFNDGVHGVKSIVDFYNFPRDIIALRKKTEALLNIEKYVHVVAYPMQMLRMEYLQTDSTRKF